MRYGLQVESYIPEAPPPAPRWSYQTEWWFAWPLPVPPTPPVLRAIRKPSIHRRARHARSNR